MQGHLGNNYGQAGAYNQPQGGFGMHGPPGNYYGHPRPYNQNSAMGGVHPDLRGPFNTSANNNAGHGMQDQFRMSGHADMRGRFSTPAGHHHHAYPGMVPDAFYGHGQQ